MKKKRLLELTSRQFLDTLTEKETSELNQLLDDADAKQLYEEIKLKWDQSGLYTPNIEINKEEAWARFQNLASERNSISPKGDYRTLIYKVAAVVLMGVALGFYFLFPTEALQKYATTAGETKEITLADGSTIFLNERSVLTISREFNGSDRIVDLNGEGFFDIARDETRPFIIHSKESTVEVLGTSFNFEAYEKKEYTQVNVVSGKVSLHKRGDKSGQVILTQGMRGIHNLEDGNIRGGTPQIDNSRAWITGKLVFDDVQMNEVIEDLNKYFQVEFKTENDAILRCRFTSTFEKPTVQEVIDVLSATLDISGREIDNSFILQGRGCTE